MTLTSQPGRTRMLLLLVLWTMTSKAATNPQAEPNDSSGLATVLSRIMRTHSSKAAEIQRPTQGAITRQLWRNRVLAPERTDDVETQIALNELVRRIRSMKFEAKELPAAAAPFAAPEPVERRLDAARDEGMARHKPVPSPAASPVTPEEPLSPRAAEALKHLIADPNQASDPLELAELLYLTGRLPEAAVLYRKALEATVNNTAAAQADRAWILLQLGNCLRDTDPAQARDMYARLVAEHPDCPWVDLAKAHSQLITWYEQVQPRQWVAGQETPPARQVAASPRSQP
ncbi:MAG: tetratricopeptide repeat protein [Sedimentisphaerales bacterium]|nr:tetratricopeptide repeat protein [Sedimentisphaerales bacterium]